MAKWKSTLFSDVRNKLGDQVVFSVWKGRSYFRSYVVPANPKTDKQQAERDHMRELVQNWTSVLNQAKSGWNEEALPRLISGYNLATKLGRDSSISGITGSGSSDIDVTYTLHTDVGKTGIAVKATSDGTWTVIKDPGDLTEGDDVTVTITTPSAGAEYEVWLIRPSVSAGGHTPAEEVQAFNKWKPDPSTGKAEAAVVASSP